MRSRDEVEDVSVYHSSNASFAGERECRPIDFKQYLRNKRSLADYYLMPLLAAMFVLLGVGFGTSLFGYEGPIKNHPVLGAFLVIVFIAAWIYLHWWHNIDPQRDYLKYSDEGFSWRMKFGAWWGLRAGRGGLRFDEIDKISFRDDKVFGDRGKEEKPKDKKEDVIEWMVDLFFPEGDLRLVLKTGQKVLLEKLLTRFNEEDTKEFLRFLAARTDHDGRYSQYQEMLNNIL